MVPARPDGTVAINEKEDTMGRIVVTEFVSLDGVIEDPGGAEDFKHGGWSFEIDRGDEGDAVQARRDLRDPRRCCSGG